MKFFIINPHYFIFNFYIPMKSHKTASNTMKSQDFPPDRTGFQRRRATDGTPL
jgi:hypothetical protein